jgi:hypothetical protein
VTFGSIDRAEAVHLLADYQALPLADKAPALLRREKESQIFFVTPPPLHPGR